MCVCACVCVCGKYINLKLTLARNVRILYGKVQIPGMNNDFTDEIGKKGNSLYTDWSSNWIHPH